MSERHDLYVGYLDTPAAHKRLVLVVIPMLALLFAMLAAVVAIAMRDPGEAVWDISQSQRWTGRLVTDPYPMLITDEGETHLVVEMGKMSAQPRLGLLAGQNVTFEGFPLERDGRQMIELLIGDDAFVSTGPETGDTFTDVVYERDVEVVGEIVDGKCFLGAMKPGDGKGHKACAVLCIEGGLPAMVRTKDGAGDWVYPLLLIDGSSTIPYDVLDLVSEPVRIEGTLGRIGDLLVLDCDAECVTPFSD